MENISQIQPSSFVSLNQLWDVLMTLKADIIVVQTDYKHLTKSFDDLAEITQKNKAGMDDILKEQQITNRILSFLFKMMVGACGIIAPPFIYHCIKTFL